MDSRGEIHAPLAQESERDSGTAASGHKGREDEGTSPTKARDHDPFVHGELKKWLDGPRADNGGLDIDSEEGWHDFCPDLSEVSSWVRWVNRRSRKGIGVGKALGQADRYLWYRLVEMYIAHLESGG